MEKTIFLRNHGFENIQNLRSDWEEKKVEIMRTALLNKFMQNKNLGLALLNTLPAHFIEDSSRDTFWGIGEDGDGKNMLGVLLMEVRDQINTKLLLEEYKEVDPVFYNNWGAHARKLLRKIELNDRKGALVRIWRTAVVLDCFTRGVCADFPYKDDELEFIESQYVCKNILLGPRTLFLFGWGKMFRAFRTKALFATFKSPLDNCIGFGKYDEDIAIFAGYFTKKAALLYQKNSY